MNLQVWRLLQAALCLPFRSYTPDPQAAARYERLFGLYRRVYYAFGERSSPSVQLGDVLAELREIAAEARLQAVKGPVDS